MRRCQTSHVIMYANIHPIIGNYEVLATSETDVVSVFYNKEYRYTDYR